MLDVASAKQDCAVVPKAATANVETKTVFIFIFTDFKLKLMMVFQILSQV